MVAGTTGALTRSSPIPVTIFVWPPLASMCSWWSPLSLLLVGLPSGYGSLLDWTCREPETSGSLCFHQGWPYPPLRTRIRDGNSTLLVSVRDKLWTPISPEAFFLGDISPQITPGWSRPFFDTVFPAPWLILPESAYTSPGPWPSASDSAVSLWEKET